MTEFATDTNDLAIETGGTLRAKLEEALKRAQAAETALAEAQNEQKKRDVAKTWEDLNVPPKFQAAYLGESNPDAITKWWGEISPLVNLEGPDVASQPTETAAQREQRDMIEATQRAANLGGDFTSDVEAGLSYARELRERNAPISKAELEDMFTKLGVPN